ncbi:MAG: Rpn family recombination-promoting nuclease/putative transposase [Prevotellaceae bacterium]|jgi:hypothetical protein|nr:Rpn family recombination-promoting nuclease/putative transposase [Prevotellaceae bacterium]
MSSKKEEERIFVSFDYALKRLLRDKANYDVLEGFLSELLSYDVKIKDIVDVKNAGGKHNEVEILAENEKGELLVVKLFFPSELDYLYRMLYDTSETLVEQAEIGRWHCEMRKVISISIDSVDFEEDQDYIYYGNAVFSGIHAHDELQLDGIQSRKYNKKRPAEIYPEYYVLKVKNFDDIVNDSLDEWIYFFKYNSIKDEFTAKGLAKAREVLLYDKLTPEEQAEYQQ